MRAGLLYPLAVMLSAAAGDARALAAADVEPFRAKLESEGARNRVLNQMEIGALSFWSGDTSAAAAALSDAIENIELVFAADPNVTKARSLWYEEGAKSFKGEPYERAMAYYYYGLCFLKAGDYENARAAFRQGLMQDAFAEEYQNQADFAVLLFLDAWASHLNGDKDLRDETLAQLKTLRPDFPGIAEGDDTLVLVETGTAPRKLGDGLDHAYFVFRRGKGFKENRVRLMAGDAALPLYPIEDVYYQATTRGGREIDKILEGKVEFRRTTGDIGSFLADSSVMVSQLGGGGTAAGALGAVGALSLLISSKAKPRADTRMWSSLPDTIHVATLSSRNQAAAHAVVAYFAGETPGAQADEPLVFEKDPNGGRIALARSR